MAPKSEVPGLNPLTPEQKATRNRLTTLESETLLGKAKACLLVHQPPPKKRRGMRKRRPFHKLAGLTTLAAGCLNFSWTKKKRSDTRIRRRNVSALAALVRVLNETGHNKHVEEHIIDRDSGIEEIISIGDSLELQTPVKVYERCKNRICTEKMKAGGCEGDGGGDSLELQPLLKVYERCKNRPCSNWCDASVSNNDNHYSTSLSFTILTPGSMEKEHDCDGILAPKEDCDGMSSFETMEDDEPSAFIDENNGSSRIDECLDHETNVMLAEFKENSIGDSEKDNSSFENGHSNRQEKLEDSKKDNSNGYSNRQDDSIPSVTDSVFDGQAESLIDILKKRCQNGAVKTQNKKKKMKRHNPKVVDPSPSPLKPPTPKLAKKKTVHSNFSTPKPAGDENGEARYKRKRTRRKLDFDRECFTMEKDKLDQVGFSQLNFQQIKKKRRTMRKRVSVVKLNRLIRSTRERMSSPYLAEDGKDDKDLKTKKVKAVINAYFGIPRPVLVKSLHKVLQRKSAYNARIRQENVLLIQDEPFFQAVEDFLTKKMESLSITEDGNGKSNQLVVQDPKQYGALVLSRKEKNRKKGPIPNVKLDEDTMKVWDLLMTSSNWSEAAEKEALGNDEYMKGQRKLFRERLERLISRMRAVHGCMKFKPWKGSVLDSIVGVYLTQNVGDNSSSSAFMTLRARYPPLSLSEQNELYCREDQQAITKNEEHSSMIQEDQQGVMGVEPTSNTQLIENGNENGNESGFEAAEATKGSKKGNGKMKKKKEEFVDWDRLRKEYSQGISRERTEHNADSVNWEAIRQASEKELASVIHRRGMNNQLSKRIKDFLDRMVKDHGSLDLEWLRHVPPLKAKDFLMSIKGLALKSTECVRLLALHFPAFPVDTNAGRFFVRMGWVPLRPLPEDVQLHLLNTYPVLDSIQKYIWPRVCDNGHPLLYEAHCHTITAAKSFCTMTKPNCNECPMRDECNHFASAHASAKLRLEGPPPENHGNPSNWSSQEAPMITDVDGNESIDQHTCHNSEPIIEFPPSPVAEPVPMEPLDGDIEDIGRDSEITTIRLSGREFSRNLHSFVSEDDELLKALVPLNPRLGSLPIPKHKVSIRLRTVHQVYELPDSHPLLHTFDEREPEDPCPYLLAIWTTDEEEAVPCDSGSVCLSGEVTRYQKFGTIKGTILIPCLTANKGAFPLNGTYFQPHEVFADHETSEQPIDVPRHLIWNLRRRFLYCGTSLASICKAMSLQEVAYSFHRSAICVRGFDRKTRFPKTLANKFHHCKSRQADNYS